MLIVGAGSAGSVLAERLSAEPARTVTVLEAGPGADETGVGALTRNGLQLPIGAASPLVARYSTELTTEPRRVAQIVRGATVGGSGAVNGGYFCRATRRDVAGWGLPGWSWGDVLAHYRAVETDLDFGDRPDHGADGPIRVRRTADLAGSTAAFVTAAERAGFSWLPDLNAGDLDAAGIGAVPLNIVDGVRNGPGAAFLEPALSRPNLTVLARTRARRITFTGGRATGVEVAGPRGPATLTADRIVLCCGALGSAQLLMLSGIGDETQLRRTGIPVTVAAPVGQRCADHPEWVLPTDWVQAPRRAVLEVVLSLPGELEIRPYTGGFVAMVGDGSAGHPDWPHLGVALMQPRARGRVWLTSADAGVPLRIEHRYDSDASDVQALRRGADLARELAAGSIGEPAWATSQHLCATAPMGLDGDPFAVTDPQCRVRGVDGLWVVDGSVLPSVPSRGPHATIVMLAHRAAEFVAQS
ncbi:mycofactocin system GMC family oxidoreductase MftG [Mycobacterium sp. MS1601]|nr:mycofactocin system GMC family oxidoreductase MftG [Mycobacterium sp. MS1601]